MATTRTPVFDSIRILGKQDDFLDRKIGQRGEIYFDDLIGSLRVFNGQVGGITLLKDDLSNISTAALNKNVNFGTGTITATQFIGAGIGAVLGDVPPVAPVAQTGTLWFNTSTGKLYIYYNDGTSLQWVQPMTPSVGGGSGGGSGSGNSFTTIAVAGQSSVAADSATDTLTFVAGTGIAITTDSNADTVTITSTVSAGATTFSALTDNAGLTADQFYLPAITKLTVTASGSSAYLFDQYSGNNPTIYAIGGTTIAFDLGTSALSSHPFLIRFSGANYSTGLVHVSTTGTVTTGASAQGKTSGTLYWKIPASVSGTYGYLCQSHGTMIGSIIVKDITVI